MAIDIEERKALPAAEKLRLFQLLWDDLRGSNDPTELPDWLWREAPRRRAEMLNPTFGLTHDEVWRRIDNRNK
jgi:hypothetical protein